MLGLLSLRRCVGLLTVGMGLSLTLCLLLELFLLLSCLIQLGYETLCLDVLHFCHMIFQLTSLESLLFSEGNRNSGPGREDRWGLGGVEGREAVVRMYCVRE